MIYYLLVISILSLLLVCFFYLRGMKVKKEIDYFIVFFPTLLAVGIIIYEFSLAEPIDARYVDKRVRELRHYSSWSEIIPNSSNLDSLDGKRDGTKVVIHNDNYSFTYLNDEGVKEERDLPKKTYDYFSKIWDNRPSMVFSDSLGRTVEVYRWNNNNGDRPILTYTMTVPYINYFKNTMGLYNQRYISDKEAEELGLFIDYNPIGTLNSDSIVEPRQSLVYGINFGDSIDRTLNYLASMSSKFRPLLLVWEGNDKDKKELISSQKSYWKGSKDNEAVFCVCVDNEVDKKIIWSGSFSWAEDKMLEEYVVNNALKPGTELDPMEYARVVIEAYGKNMWNPRDFSNYSFCKMPLEDLNIVLAMLALIVVNVVISIKIVKKNNNLKKNESNQK